MTDSMNLAKLIQEVKPHEKYNLAFWGNVHVSFDVPEYVADADVMETRTQSFRVGGRNEDFRLKIDDKRSIFKGWLLYHYELFRIRMILDRHE